MRDLRGEAAITGRLLRSLAERAMTVCRMTAAARSCERADELNRSAAEDERDGKGMSRLMGEQHEAAEAPGDDAV